MRYSTAVVLGALSSSTLATPLTRRAVTKFPAGTTFDIALQGQDLTLADYQNSKAQVIDIDLDDNYEDGELTTISELAKTKKVVCYFSAGSREDWRNDASKFLAADYGQEMIGWKGENWVNVKSENVKNIMRERIERAAKAGCHAVDPDNVDGFVNNQDGFGYDRSFYIDYIKYLAQVATDNKMSMGLKNSIEIIKDVIDVVEFAVNEQCHAFWIDDAHSETECIYYKPFTTANKAVFNIEYGINNCTDPAGVNLSTLIKGEDQSLDKLGGQC